jgi:hypothetical protein
MRRLVALMVVMAAMLALTVAPAFAGPVLSPASPTQGVMALVVSLGIALGVAGLAYAVTALSDPEEGADDPVPVRNHPPRVTTTHKVM